MPISNVPEALEWPQFVVSHDYIPPEATVQIPMDVFKTMIEKAQLEKRPAWWKDAVESGAENVFMIHRSASELVEVGGTLPAWLLAAAGEEEEWEPDEDILSCPWCGCTDQTKLIWATGPDDVWCENGGCPGDGYRLPMKQWNAFPRTQETGSQRDHLSVAKRYLDTWYEDVRDGDEPNAGDLADAVRSILQHLKENR